jgi:hypothetical protein
VSVGLHMAGAQDALATGPLLEPKAARIAPRERVRAAGQPEARAAGGLTGLEPAREPLEGLDEGSQEPLAGSSRQYAF